MSLTHFTDFFNRSRIKYFPRLQHCPLEELLITGNTKKKSQEKRKISFQVIQSKSILKIKNQEKDKKSDISSSL
jgi:hypothetical protein